MLIFLASAKTALAVTIASDSFTVGAGYTAGLLTPQSGSPSAVNFTGNWGGSQTGYYQVVSSSLSLSGYAGTGGSLLVQTRDDGTFSRNSSHTFTADTTSSSTLWFSSLYQPSTGAFENNNEAMMGFTSGSPPLTADGTTLGASWTSSNGAGLAGFAWGINTGTNNSNTLKIKYQSDFGGSAGVVLADTGVALTIGTTYFLIGKIALNAAGNQDTLNVWIRTSLPTNETSLGAANWSISTANLLNSSSNLNTLLLFGGAGTQEGATVDWRSTYYDSVRIGTTFADIVPEPSRFLLLGFAFLGLFYKRRR